MFKDKQGGSLLPLYPFSPMTNKSDTTNNESIYKKMTKIRGKIIYVPNPESACDKLYNVYFDPEIFYTCIGDKNAALYRISYRKNGKYFTQYHIALFYIIY